MLLTALAHRYEPFAFSAPNVSLPPPSVDDPNLLQDWCKKWGRFAQPIPVFVPSPRAVATGIPPGDPAIQFFPEAKAVVWCIDFHRCYLVKESCEDIQAKMLFEK